MDLRFNHIHQNKMFKFLELDYDPERVISKITEKTMLLGDKYEVSVNVDRKLYFEYQVKQSDIYCLLYINLIQDQLDLDLQFELVIPDIRNSFCTISGVRRYVQKQLRDTIFIHSRTDQRTKVLHDLERSFSLYYLPNQKTFGFNVQGLSHIDAVASYLYLLDDNKDEELSDLDHPVIQNLVQEYLLLNDKETMLKNVSKSVSASQKRRILNYVIAYYLVSDLLQEYFKDPADVILSMFKNLDKTDEEQGLDVRNRRIRTSEEMIVSTFLSKIVDYLLEALFISNKNKRKKQVRIEPFQHLYDFVLVENMFDAPLASVSNRARCTLLGQGGFTRDNVPTRIKDLHPSQYNCLDPAVTPDRDNAGVVLYIATTANLDEFGRFEINKEFLEETLKGVNGETAQSDNS